MAGSHALADMNCPECGGVLSIPEGQAIVVCEFCGRSLIVKGDRGVARRQVPALLTRGKAEEKLKRFLSSSNAVDWTARFRSRVRDCFLIYVPFWQLDAGVLAWMFGHVEVSQGAEKVLRPKEFKIAEPVKWTMAAAEMGEFGVTTLQLEGINQEPYNGDELHARALVFEPVGSPREALENARKDLQSRLIDAAEIKKRGQELVHLVNQNLSLVYYPLWVLRYEFRKRTFQIVIDGHTGEVVFGKAPGNTLFRAVMLVGSAALGAFLMVDIPALLLWFGFTVFDLDDDLVEVLLALVAASFGAGFFMVRKGYRQFRYGEHYDYRPYEGNVYRPLTSYENGVTRLRLKSTR